MTKITPKYYEYGSVTCDMTNTRKRFFKVMCGDVQVADLEITHNKLLNEGETYYSLLTTLKNHLEERIYHDIMELICEITRDINFKFITLTHLRRYENQLIVHFFEENVDDFPKFRRKKQENGEFLRRVHVEGFLPNIIQKTLIGRYMFFEYGNRKIILNEDTYKKLPVQNKISIRKDSQILPVILQGDETLCLKNSFVYAYVNDLKILETIKIHFDETSQYISRFAKFDFEVFVDDDSFDKYKNIILPDTSYLNKRVVFRFMSRNKPEKRIKLNETMFDFSNQKHRVCISNDDVILFNGVGGF